MGITATIMNTLTGRSIQKMTFERMPKPWASFTLENGKLVSAERIDVGKAPRAHRLGQDTHTILSELGYSADQIQALADQGVILNSN